MSADTQDTSLVYKSFISQGSRDIEAVLSTLSENFIFEDVSIGTFTRSRKQFGYVLSSLFGAFPDARLEVVSSFQTGSAAAVAWMFSGTHTGPFSGFRPSQKLVTCRGASLLELGNGLITRRTDYWDVMTVLRNLMFVK